MREQPTPQRIGSRPPEGGGLGAFLLPEHGHSPRRKKQGLGSPLEIPAAGVMKVEAASAPPLPARFPFPENLGRVISDSPSFCTVWQQAAVIAFGEHRLLIRARPLTQLLTRLRTTRYRMEQHGLKPLGQLGCRTTLYRLAEVLTVFIIAASDTRNLKPERLVAELERIIFDGLREKFGAEIHAKYLPGILGGTKVCELAQASEDLRPSLRQHRCVLFPLKGLERAVRSLVRLRTETLTPSRGRTR